MWFTLPHVVSVILCVELNSDVLVSGVKHRNRAVHGDMVVVELLPRNEWNGRTMALTEGQGEERSLEDTQSQPMPTGNHGSYCTLADTFLDTYSFLLLF